MSKKKICAFLGITLLLTGCFTDSEGATKALDDMGFTDIKTGGYNYFACSQDDWYHTSFTAKNQNGKLVKGTVCAGFLFKNSTVRFD